MTIKALPEATVRLLGSTQALTTPTSLVKELIDNALDAKATHIDILISPNTIDKIEVRDNGHGIQLEDLDSLGKRGHTSKLRSFDELRTIGGTSLGFRGEALFSAVQLGQVSVTTKTEGEAVATSVKLKTLGGVESRTKTSHPLGTTISIMNFLSRLPVRHQTALKEAPKTLSKVKELLQSYALARPHVRFNLKVAKGGKGSWSFAPRSNDGIREAVSQVIGREAAIQCIQKSLSFSEVADRHDINATSDSTDVESRNKKFLVDMFLPQSESDISKISHGQYISIDGRPVSHDKGTMKRIITIFKRYIRASFPESAEKIKNPFLRLSISCPVGSYDPNVEPAKDDVIFCNEYLVLEKIEQAFKELYGEPKSTEPPSPAKPLSSRMNNFELLLARKPLESNSDKASQLSLSNTHQIAKPASATTETIATDREKDIVPSISKLKRGWEVDMSEDCSEEVEPDLVINQRTKDRTFRQIPDTEDETQPVEPLTPWIIAKLIAPVREQSDDSSSKEPRNVGRINQHILHTLATPQQSSDPACADDIDLLTPVSQIQNSRNPGIESSIHRSLEELTPGEPVSQSENPALITNRRPLTASSDEGLFLTENCPPITHRRNDFISARNVMNSQLVTPSFHLSGLMRQKQINKPYISSLHTNRNPPIHDGMRQTRLSVGTRPNRSLDEEDNNTELAWAMDFENRKEEATRRRKEQLRTARIEAESLNRAEEDIASASPSRLPTRSSPHKNRYAAAVATLDAGYPQSQPSEPISEVFKTALPDIDPRGYLMRRQKSLLKPGAPKMSRAKSMRLPMERIPDGEQLNRLLLRFPTNMNYLKRVCREVGKEDGYITRGVQSHGLTLNAVEKQKVVERLRQVVDGWRDSMAGQDSSEVEYFLDNLRCVA